MLLHNIGDGFLGQNLAPENDPDMTRNCLPQRPDNAIVRNQAKIRVKGDICLIDAGEVVSGHLRRHIGDTPVQTFVQLRQQLRRSHQSFDRDDFHGKPGFADSIDHGLVDGDNVKPFMGFAQ